MKGLRGAIDADQPVADGHHQIGKCPGRGVERPVRVEQHRPDHAQARRRVEAVAQRGDGAVTEDHIGVADQQVAARKPGCAQVGGPPVTQVAPRVHPDRLGVGRGDDGTGPVGGAVVHHHDRPDAVAPQAGQAVDQTRRGVEVDHDGAHRPVRLSTDSAVAHSRGRAGTLICGRRRDTAVPRRVRWPDPARCGRRSLPAPPSHRPPSPDRRWRTHPIR